MQKAVLPVATGYALGFSFTHRPHRRLRAGSGTHTVAAPLRSAGGGALRSTFVAEHDRTTEATSSPQRSHPLVTVASSHVRDRIVRGQAAIAELGSSQLHRATPRLHRRARILRHQHAVHRCVLIRLVAAPSPRRPAAATAAPLRGISHVTRYATARAIPSACIYRHCRRFAAHLSAHITSWHWSAVGEHTPSQACRRALASQTISRALAPPPPGLAAAASVASQRPKKPIFFLYSSSSFGSSRSPVQLPEEPRLW